MKRVGRAIVVVALVALAAGHAFACRRFCGDEATHRSRWPLLTDDHPLHYANAASTRHHFQHSFTNAGYDPFFMSGYTKSSIWPTNALLEAAVFALPTYQPADVFKGFAWLSAAAVPVAMIYAGWRFRMTPAVILLGVFSWCAQYWAGAPFHTFQYVHFGMSAFVFSVALTLAAGASLQHWLDMRTPTAAVEMSVLSALALAAHPTVAVILGVPAIAAFVMHSCWRDRRAVRQALFAMGFIVAANYWWLVPLVALRSTWAGSPPFFNNPNVLERLADLFEFDDTVPFLLAPALVGVLFLLSILYGRRSGVVPPLMIGWIFLIAIPAGVFENLAFLQVGRNTLHLTAWVCLPGSAMIAVIAARWHVFPRTIVLAAAAWCFVCSVPLPVENLRTMFVVGKSSSTAQMYPQHARLLEALGKEAPTARRVLFEVYENRDSVVQGMQNPYGSIRLAPIIPMETGLEVVGGPYLMTHYKTNFANCGEGEFIGRGRWNRADFDEYARIYALDLAVLWSQPALAFAQRSPDALKPIDSFAGIHFFRIARPKAQWEAAGLRIKASFNRIEIENPQGAKGTFVLPYHATIGWSASPDCKILSTKQGADPVPFLTLVDPPEKVALTFSPWTLGGLPPSP